MTTATRTNLEATIDELHRAAARELALAAEWQAHYPWRRHDVPRAKERAAEFLAAVKILEGEL